MNHTKSYEELLEQISKQARRKVSPASSVKKTKKRQNDKARFTWEADHLDQHDDKKRKLLGEKAERPVGGHGKDVFNPKVIDEHEIDPHESHKMSNEDDEEFINHHDSLSSVHHDLISRYKDSSEGINAPLRQNKGFHSDKNDWDQHRRHVALLDQVTSHKTKKDMHAYRSFGGSIPLADMKAGATFTDHGYTGCSLHHSTAEDFAKVHDSYTPHPKDPNLKMRNTHTYVAKIRIPGGTKAHFLDNASANHDNLDEHEVLIHRGTTYKVVGHSVIPPHHDDPHPCYRHIVHLEVHHQPDHPDVASTEELEKHMARIDKRPIKEEKSLPEDKEEKPRDPKDGHFTWDADDVEHHPHDNKSPLSEDKADYWQASTAKSLAQAAKHDTIMAKLNAVGKSEPKKLSDMSDAEFAAYLKANHPSKTKIDQGDKKKPEKVQVSSGHGKDVFNPKVVDKSELKPSKMSEAAEKAHAKNHDNLTMEKRWAVKDYKQSSNAINRALRQRKGNLKARTKTAGPLKPNTSEAKNIAHLDEVTSHRTTEEHHVFRTFGGSIPLKELKAGAKFTDHGYTGTSLKHSVATGFAATHNVKKDPEKWDSEVTSVHRYIAKIRVPKGTKAHYLDNSSASHDHKSEKELLIHRGTTYKVVGHSVVPPSPGSKMYDHIVHLEVHKQRP